MATIDTATPAAANSLRTRALATNMLRPATRSPAIMAISSVLVWVSSSMTAATTATSSGDAPADLAAEPEHDHQPDRDRREVRDLRGGDRPELAGEPALGQGAARGHEQAEQHRAEHDAERREVAPDEQQVTPAPPRRQQPERGDEPSEPEGPVQGADE